jgi:hypothetical protein
MNNQQQIKVGTVLRTGFKWKDEPKADGKVRNCVVIAHNGRRAVVCPITSLSKTNTKGCHRIDGQVKKSIAKLGDDKDSWVNLNEQNIIYLDGPSLERRQDNAAGDRRIFGQLPAAMAQSLSKEAVDLKVKPSKKQIEDDWKEDVMRLKTSDSMAKITQGMTQSTTLDERVRQAAARKHERMTADKTPRKTLSLSGSSGGTRGQER